ncbi:MAG: DUF393 domain-containing protein [Pseudomonadota bacterium]
MSKETEVLYNAECPICRFEIDHYRAYSSQKDLPIRFDDLNSDARVAWDIDEDKAARRLYVRHLDQLYSGIPAFLILWQNMPRYRWLARIIGLPGIKQLASMTYDYILAPLIYNWHMRRRKKSGRPVKTNAA